MSTEQGLFSADLISEAVAKELPEGYTARSLRLSDYDGGFLDCLRVLTTVGDIKKEQFAERYEWMRKSEANYVLVIDDGTRVVGTGALLVERKL